MSFDLACVVRALVSSSNHTHTHTHTRRSEAQATAIYADGKKFLDLYLELTGMSLRLVMDLLLKK